MVKRKIEDITGIGKLYKNEEYIATVNYILTIEEEILNSKSLQGIEPIPGQKIITAHFIVVDGERDLVDPEVFTLTLQDGRQWRCIIPNGDFITGTYKAVSSGGAGIIAK